MEFLSLLGVFFVIGVGFMLMCAVSVERKENMHFGV